MLVLFNSTNQVLLWWQIYKQDNNERWMVHDVNWFK